MNLTPLTHAVALATAALAAVLTALALAGPAGAATLPAGSTALLSGRPSLFDAFAAPVGSAAVTTEAVSQDGRFVAFTSTSDGLVTDDDDLRTNVFRKDTLTGDVVLVSRRDGAAGEPSHDECYDAAISDDGRRVAFTCDGPLDPADTNGRRDVYVRTPASGATVLASRSVSGQAGDDQSREPTLSEDGDYVAFTSQASNLVPGPPTSALTNVFRRHLPTQTTIVASRRNGAAGAEAAGTEPSISDDGNLIAYTTADRGETADTNNAYDVYVRDVAAGATKLVSRAGGGNGEVGNGYSVAPAIAGNGLSVAFASDATNLDARDTDQTRNIYRRSFGLLTTTVLDANGAGVTSGYAHSPSVDDSGSVIAFVSTSTTLDPADTDPSADVYVKNLGLSGVTVASRAEGASGTVANLAATSAAMSGDGYQVASALQSGGVTPDADPRKPSVILRRLDTHATRSVARPPGDAPFVNEAGDSDNIALTPDGRYAAFRSEAAGLGLPRTSANGIFVRDRLTGSITLASRADGPDGAPFARASGGSISDDGRRVAFSGAEQPGRTSQAWVRDLAEGRTYLASRADGPDGAPGNDRTRRPRLDADGSRVVFRTLSTNLGNGDADAIEDIHVRDLETGATILVSRADGPDGTKGDGASSAADIDAGGTRVAFATSAKNLGDGDTDTDRDVHLRDLDAGTTRLVSATPAGTKANADVANELSIDAAGTRVAFATAATTLGDTSTDQKAFVRDLAGETLVVVGKGTHAAISPDGGYVAFTGPDGQARRHDLAQGQSEIVSRYPGPAGAPGTRSSWVHDISAQGACVGFETDEPFVGPRREVLEAYVHAVTADCGDAAAGPAGGGGQGPGGGPVVQPDGRPSAGDTLAPVLSRVRLARQRFRAARGTVLRFRSSEAATLTLSVQRIRRGRRRPVRVGTLTRRIEAGDGRVRLRGRVARRALRRGRHRLTVSARDATGNRSRPVRLRFTVVPAGG